MLRTCSPVFPLGVVGMLFLLIGSAFLLLHALINDLYGRRWHHR
jgi:hypothetical protein